MCTLRLIRYWFLYVLLYFGLGEYYLFTNISKTHPLGRYCYVLPNCMVTFLTSRAVFSLTHNFMVCSLVLLGSWADLLVGPVCVPRDLPAGQVLVLVSSLPFLIVYPILLGILFVSHLFR